MLGAAAVAFAVALILTPWLAAWARRRDLLDRPSHRSSHVVATPRLGGVALVIGFVAGVTVLIAGGHDVGLSARVVLAGALCIALLGLADDLRQLDALVRLFAQVGVALIVVLMAGVSVHGPSGWFVAAVIVFWLVAVTNAYNFMDGIDGIAGTQALVAGAGWAVVGWLVGEPMLAAIGLVLATVSAGFLLYNWQPARVFMGDAGSGFLGFLLAALPLTAAQIPGPRASVLWGCAVLLLWPFLADTGFTLLRRALRRENVLAAHRSHVYQRLVISGLTHRDVTLRYAVMGSGGCAAAIALATGRTGALLALVCLIFGAAVTTWWHAVRRERAREGRSPQPR